MAPSQKPQPLLNWKQFLTVTLETVIAFYLATFCLAMFFLHRPLHWITLGVIMGVLYLLVIGICIKRALNKLPLSALMLIIPIAPLLALIMILSLIPLLQFLK